MRYLLLPILFLSGCATTQLNQSTNTPPPASDVVVEEGAIYFSPSLQSHDFELGIDHVAASLKRTFSDRDRIYPLQPQGWRIDLQLWIKETQRSRISRIEKPVKITKALDERGRDIISRTEAQDADRKNPFISGGEERRDIPPRHATAQLFPKQLPQKISLIRGVIPVEVADESDSLDVILDEEKQADLGNGMTVVIRPLNEAARNGKVMPLIIMIQCKDPQWPSVKSVFTTGPDRRIRDIGSGNYETLPDGSRQWTYNTAIDISKSEIKSTLRIERVLSVKELPIEFEFTNIPVGAER